MSSALSAGVATGPGALVGRARFAANAATNLAYFVLSTVLMFWYVPFLVWNLGPAVYGAVPLVNALVMYAALITDGLNTSAYRYLSIDLGRGDTDAARRTFNGAAAVTLVGCAILLAPAAAVSWLFPTLFHVPPGYEGEARFLFASVCVTVFASLVGGPFSASSQIAHRFDLRNAARAATLVTRVGCVALLFWAGPARLWHVGAGFLTSAAVGLACEVLIWWYLTPQLVFQPHRAKAEAVRGLLGLSGWATVNMLGFLLLVQVDVVIVNVVFGAEATGRYGSILLLPALVVAVAEIVMPMLSPEIMARYAVGDRAGIERLVERAIRLLCVGLALPVGLLCGFGAPILSLWLGRDFVGFDPVLVLLCGHLAGNLALRPLAYVLTAYNRVRAQALVSLVTGVANVGLALLFARWGGWGVAGVAAAVALIWTARNLLFLAAYGAATLGLPWWSFLRPLLPGTAGLLGVAMAGRIMAGSCALADWASLAAAAGAVAIAYGVVAYALLLNASDRRQIDGLIPGRSR